MFLTVSYGAILQYNRHRIGFPVRRGPRIYLQNRSTTFLTLKTKTCFGAILIGYFGSGGKNFNQILLSIVPLYTPKRLYTEPMIDNGSRRIIGPEPDLIGFQVCRSDPDLVISTTGGHRNDFFSAK